MFLFLIIVLFIFVIPVILVYLNIIPSKYKLFVLGIAVLIIPLLTFLLNWNIKMLGFRLDNIVTSLIPYSIFTIVGIFVLVSLAKTQSRGITKNLHTNSHFKFLFIPISFAQEFLFHAFLFTYSLQILNSVLLSIILNSILFALIHIFYPKKIFSLVFAFISGFGFTTMYYYYPNLIIITIMHSVLNYIAVMYGFFSNTYKS